MADRKEILIVDDDPGMTDTLYDIFEAKNYAVTLASNGFEAIELVRNKSYPLILMDIKMPKINGLDTFRKIKAIDPLSTVCLMTAYCKDEDIRQAKSEGVLHVFSKPLDIERLLTFFEKKCF